MGEVTAEYMDVFCKSGAFIGCDDFPDYVSLHPGYGMRSTSARDAFFGLRFLCEQKR